MRVVGRIAPMIEISAGFDPELSGYENIYLSCTLMGLSTFEIDSRISEIIDFSELQKFIDMPLKNYSSGMLARLGFACATAVDPDIILADEVLAVGDANFELKCLDKIARLREKGTTVILVSHSQAAVEKFCTRGIVFYEGEIKCDGPISQAVEEHNKWLEYRRKQH
jgi:ABC-type polysaccharide/polyol phosphate transport system ATPase subunit